MMSRRTRAWRILALALALGLAGCKTDETKRDAPDTPDVAAEDTTTTDMVAADGATDAEVAADDVDAGDAVAPAPTTPGGLPLALPFSFERPDVGEPLTDEEIAHFTKRITGLLKQIDYYTWVYEVSHGTDASTGMPAYLIWWHDVEAHKAGDLVTFVNNKEDGGSHNNAVPSMLALAQVIGGYLSAPAPDSARLLEELTRSIHAVTLGFVYDEDDPIDFLMSRNLITQNHAFTLPSGKEKAVDYTEWFFCHCQRMEHVS